MTLRDWTNPSGLIMQRADLTGGSWSGLVPKSEIGMTGRRLRIATREAPLRQSLIPSPSIVIRDVLAEIRELEPNLIEHLREHSEDLERIDPEVFEHLVGEFFVQRQMFSEIALVGRDSSTSADLFCATTAAAGEREGSKTATDSATVIARRVVRRRLDTGRLSSFLGYKVDTCEFGSRAFFYQYCAAGGESGE